ncbi:saccharopine dehydrogenase, partial [Pseudomonadales bacterium]|nr:saccharopine dehydrogenase [Pseudomonadales bacterium]
ILLVGQNADGQVIKASVKGDMDPGYGSTSKMIAESAVCLLENPDAASGGIWTPASAMGSLLIDRLQNNAGLTFALENA